MGWFNHQPDYYLLYMALYAPAGCLGCIPSTVKLEDILADQGWELGNQGRFSLFSFCVLVQLNLGSHPQLDSRPPAACLILA